MNFKIIKKYKDMNIIIKATFWFMFATIIQKAINFITMPIFTRIMEPSEYGLYTMYISWLNIFSIFTSLKLDGSVFNKSMSKFKNDRDGFIASIQIETLFLTLFCAIIYLIFHKFFNSLTEMSTTLMLLMFLQLLFQPSYTFWMLKQRYEYKYISFMLITIISAILSTTIGIIYVLSVTNNKGYARILPFAIIQIILGIVFFIINNIKGYKKIKFDYIKYVTIFNLPLIPHYISHYILDQLDRIMIQKMVNLTKTAIYNSAYTIAMILKIVTDSFIAAITPWYYDRLEKKEYDKIKKIFIPIFSITMLFITSFILVTPELFKIILPEKYYESIYVIPPVSISIVFLMMYSFFSLPEFFFESTKFSMYMSLIGAVMNFILNYIFIKRYGYLAAGYTTMICYLFFALSHYWYSNKILNKNIKEVLFSQHKVYLICFISILVATISPFIYKYIILRLIIILIIATILFANKKKIVNYYKIIKNKND